MLGPMRTGGVGSKGFQWAATASLVHGQLGEVGRTELGQGALRLFCLKGAILLPFRSPGYSGEKVQASTAGVPFTASGASLKLEASEGAGLWCAMGGKPSKAGSVLAIREMNPDGLCLASTARSCLASPFEGKPKSVFWGQDPLRPTHIWLQAQTRGAWS